MAIDSNEVARQTMKGLQDAQRTYAAWSGYWWTQPEYMLTVSIARAVHGLTSVEWVTMEHNTRETLKEAGGGKGRPAKSLPSSGRFDIVVWGPKRPEGVIEVKRTPWTIARDVERVCAAIANQNAIGWGLVAYLYSWGDGIGKPGRNRVKDRTQSLASRAEKYVGGRFWIKRHCGKLHAEDGGAWRAEVLEIRRRVKRRNS